MQFATTVNIEKQPVSINHNNRIMLVGSCFTENIGRLMDYYGFRIHINPCGILYNPVSIAKSLEITLSGEPLTDSDLVFGNGLWHSWLHHGKFSHPDKEICLQQCNSALYNAYIFLKNTDILILTLGTAFVYQLVENGTVVANCHKMPGGLFSKRLTTVEALVDTYNSLIDNLLLRNPDLRIIFTVSPIRHWKDGYRQNTLSKAVLHLLVEELQKSHGNVFYFPAYEIVMDELRDYRFYDTDMLHPSAVAVDYIWEKFTDAYCSEQTMELCQKVGQWRKMRQHRPLFPQNGGYQAFTEKMEKIEKELKERLPHLN